MHPIVYCVFWLVLQGFSLLAVNWVLARRLNPRLDPLLKKYVWFVDLIPAFTSRYSRAAIYAGLVVRKAFFAKKYPEVMAMDLKKGLSRSTVTLCWVSFLGVYVIIAQLMLCFLLLKLGVFGD